MADQDEQIHLTATEARGGSTPGVMRYVLGISLMLVIAAFVIIWAIYQ